jgi:hypothetical protein
MLSLFGLYFAIFHNLDASSENSTVAIPDFSCEAKILMILFARGVAARVGAPPAALSC